LAYNQHILPSKLLFSKLGAFIDPAIVLSMFMLSLIFVIVWGLFEPKRIFADFFLSYVCRLRFSYQEGIEGWNPINRFNLFAARIFKNPVESIIYDVAEFSRE
jgi:hypothetical protein